LEFAVILAAIIFNQNMVKIASLAFWLCMIFYFTPASQTGYRIATISTADGNWL